MVKKLFYEDVEVGMDIPILVKHPSTRQLVKWAGVSGDLSEVHYDKDFAQASGLPGVIAQGGLCASFLGQLMVDWIGEEGTLKKLGCSYRSLNFPGKDLICKGKVTSKYAKGNEHYMECEIWAENTRGERTTQGNALVILPSKEVKQKRG